MIVNSPTFLFFLPDVGFTSISSYGFFQMKESDASVPYPDFQVRTLLYVENRTSSDQFIVNFNLLS